MSTCALGIPCHWSDVVFETVFWGLRVEVVGEWPVATSTNTRIDFHFQPSEILPFWGRVHFLVYARPYNRRQVNLNLLVFVAVIAEKKRVTRAAGKIKTACANSRVLSSSA